VNPQETKEGLTGWVTHTPAELVPYLIGKKAGKPHEVLYWRFGEQWAIRKGDWKLVASEPDGKEPRLFNLKEDIGEAKDQSAAHPEKVKELRTDWKAWNAEQKPPLWVPANQKP
jgi:arylsulfatase A-like enzyme